MNTVHLGGLDMNLVVALDALLAERSVTRAARRMGVTQPAMSHALSRLRDLVGDPLFVRTAAGMQPTERALGLAPTLSRALAEIHRVISAPEQFDPRTAKRTFTLATSDYTEFLLLPSLMDRLAREAPNVNVDVRAGADVEPLAQGLVDLVVRPMPSRLTSGFHAEELFRERFVCVVRKGNPLGRGRLTLDRYCSASHVLVSPSGARTGTVDELLARSRRKRRVALVVPHFLVAPHVVAGTDLVLTIGESIARTLQTVLPLVVVAPPLELPGMVLSQVWHERQAHDPAQAWLRERLGEIGKTVASVGSPRRSRTGSSSS